MMKRMSCVVMSFAILACAVSTAQSADGDAGSSADVKQEREAGFKANKRDMALIKDALSNGDLKAVIAPANEMAAFGAKIPGLFPPGSGGGFLSGPKDEVWKDFSGFEQKAKDFQANAQGLADAAKAGDGNLTLDAYRKVQESCAACHKAYRR